MNQSMHVIYNLNNSLDYCTKDWISLSQKKWNLLKLFFFVLTLTCFFPASPFSTDASSTGLINCCAIMIQNACCRNRLRRRCLDVLWRWLVGEPFATNSCSAQLKTIFARGNVLLSVVNEAFTLTLNPTSGVGWYTTCFISNFWTI
jgi:hypothetical protein